MSTKQIDYARQLRILTRERRALNSEIERAAAASIPSPRTSEFVEALTYAMQLVALASARELNERSRTNGDVGVLS